ncbi:MAG: hypothetical protein M3209_14675 [Acidobacteriota bacterium]|nr:hypothetical protein [Acidobacteriota bacterium]
METAAARTNSGFAYTIFDLESGDENSRLDSLLAANAEIALQKQAFRIEKHETEAALMSSPVTAKEAYGYFGLLLGLLPPAAVFGKGAGYGLNDNMPVVFVFCLLINLTCAFVGKYIAEAFAHKFVNLERKSWTKMLLWSTFLGFCWAVITGAAGGAIFFGVGAIFGVICAVPVGIAAFPAFAAVHRLLERGTEIEWKHFLPLAFGISTAISAFILGL